MVLVRSLALFAVIALFVLLVSLVEPREAVSVSKFLRCISLCKDDTTLDELEKGEVLRKAKELGKKKGLGKGKVRKSIEAAFQARDVLLEHKANTDDVQVRERLRTLAEAEDLGFVFEFAQASELLALTENKDEHCGNDDYERRYDELTSAAQNKHPVLFDYLKHCSQNHRDFCKEHPRQVIFDFKSNDLVGWKLIVKFGDAATNRVAKEERARLNGPLLFELLMRLTQWVFQRMKLAHVLGGLDFDSVAKITVRKLHGSCESFSKNFGRASEGAAERPRAGVTEAEMAKWIRYLGFCSELTKMLPKLW